MRRMVLLASVLILECALARADEPPEIEWRIEATFVPGPERLSISFARLPVSEIKPWLSAETSAADVSLSGDWQSAATRDCNLKFLPRIEAGYVYDIHRAACEDGMAAEFTGTLHRIDHQLLLVVVDLWAGVMPVYGLFKVEIHDDTMSLFSIDQQSFGLRMAAVNFEHKDGHVVAPTSTLESFVSTHVSDPTFFLKVPDYVYKR